MTGGRTRPAWIDIDGIVLLDKPPGMSSNAALQRVRRAWRAAKAGHTGSLDPLATGMLPICFGEATKLAGYLLGSAKAYRCRARLGTTTDTGDADGAVLQQRPVPALDRDRVEAALAPLRGRIRQRPPAYSALKQGGEPLYRKARRGELVEVPEREVEVFRLDLLGMESDRLELEVECGSGTYVRSLVGDLGEALGCGAHVEMLRRTWVEPFRDRPMATLEQLEDPVTGAAAREAALLDLEAGLAGWPRVDLDADRALRLARGQQVEADAADAEAAVAAGPGGLLGLVRIADGRVRARRLFRWAEAFAQAVP